MDEKHEGLEIKVGDCFTQKRPSNGNSERTVLEMTRTGVVLQAANGSGPRTHVSLRTLRKDYVRALPAGARPTVPTAPTRT